MIRTVIAAAVMLSGCAATVPAPSSPITVPVPVPCITKAPERPDLVPDAELEAMSEYQLVYALWRDRLQRIGYEAELEAVVAACGNNRLSDIPDASNSARYWPTRPEARLAAIREFTSNLGVGGYRRR